MPAKPPDRMPLPGAVIYSSAALRPEDIVVRTFPFGEGCALAVDPAKVVPDLATLIQTRTKITPASRAEPPSGGIEGRVVRDEFAVYWQPGRIVLEGPTEVVRPLVAAALDIDWVFRELKSLEVMVGRFEKESLDDVRRAYTIRRRDREHWPRLLETMEKLAVTRLLFARMEPAASVPAPDLTPLARKVFRSLLRQTCIAERLEAAGDRLEALEDLYEGAVDRINDHRYWRVGHRLEVGIIVILLVECAMIFADLYLRFQEANAE